MKNKIYCVYRTDSANYDEYRGFIVVAPSLEELRKEINKQEDGRNCWYTSEMPPYEIDKIGEATGKYARIKKITFILADFNAG